MGTVDWMFYNKSVVNQTDNEQIEEAGLHPCCAGFL